MFSLMVSILKRLYFYLCYNTNWIINFNIVLGIVLPYFLLYSFQSINKSFFFPILLIVYSTFVYSLMYIINDFFDRRKDKEKKIYKFSLYSEYGINLTLYLFIYFCFLLFFLFGFYFFDLYSLSYIGFIYLFLTSIVAFFHSKYVSIKMVTIFIERFMKIFFPLLMISFYCPDFAPYFCFVLFSLPIILDEDYVDYLTKKLNIVLRNRYYFYIVYYFLFFLLFFFLQLSFPYYLDLFIYVFIFFVIQYLSKNFSLNFSFLFPIYGKLSNKQNFILTYLLINLFLTLICISGNLLF